MGRVVELFLIEWGSVLFFTIINIHGLVADALRYFGLKKSLYGDMSLVSAPAFAILLSLIFNKYFAKASTKEFIFANFLFVVTLIVVVHYMFSNFFSPWF